MHACENKLAELALKILNVKDIDVNIPNAM